MREGAVAALLFMSNYSRENTTNLFCTASCEEQQTVLSTTTDLTTLVELRVLTRVCSREVLQKRGSSPREGPEFQTCPY